MTWWQALGKWLNIPGEISIQIIGYNNSIFSDTKTKNIYEKTFTISYWFFIFNIIFFDHLKSSETTFSSIISMVLDFEQKQKLSSPLFQSISAAILFITFLSLLIPLLSIIYSIVASSIIRFCFWLGWIIKNSFEANDLFYFSDTIGRIVHFYRHISLVIIFIMENILILQWFDTNNIQQLISNVALIVTVALIVMLFFPLLIVIIRKKSKDKGVNHYLPPKDLGK